MFGMGTAAAEVLVIETSRPVSCVPCAFATHCAHSFCVLRRIVNHQAVCCMRVVADINKTGGSTLARTEGLFNN